MTNILQSEPWAEFQRALGHTVLQRSGDGWSWQATVEGGRAGRYLYAPYGPLAETVGAFEAALESLREAAAESGCWFVRIEPAFAAIHTPRSLYIAYWMTRLCVRCRLSPPARVSLQCTYRSARMIGS